MYGPRTALPMGLRSASTPEPGDREPRKGLVEILGRGLLRLGFVLLVPGLVLDRHVLSLAILLLVFGLCIRVLTAGEGVTKGSWETFLDLSRARLEHRKRRRG